MSGIVSMRMAGSATGRVTRVRTTAASAASSAAKLAAAKAAGAIGKSQLDDDGADQTIEHVTHGDRSHSETADDDTGSDDDPIKNMT